jgi:hypothetical protein
MEALERKFRQVSENKISITNKTPSLLEMLDGEQVIARETGKNPRLYIKIGTKLYYSEFTEVTKGT